MEELTYFRHPQALVESPYIGKGTRVWAFAHVMSEARVGEYCNICDCVFVESRVRVGNYVTIKNGVSLWDGVVLEDRVFVGPNAVFTNDKNPRAARRKAPEELLPTVVREGASIGANATVVCGVEIGRYAFVGAGAVVTRSVPEYAIIVGNPARKVGYMCECGDKILPGIACACGRTYRMSGGALVPVAAAIPASIEVPLPAIVHMPLGTDPAAL